MSCLQIQTFISQRNCFVSAMLRGILSQPRIKGMGEKSCVNIGSLHGFLGSPAIEEVTTIDSTR